MTAKHYTFPVGLTLSNVTSFHALWDLLNYRKGKVLPCTISTFRADEFLQQFVAAVAPSGEVARSRSTGLHFSQVIVYRRLQIHRRNAQALSNNLAQSARFNEVPLGQWIDSLFSTFEIDHVTLCHDGVSLWVFAFVATATQPDTRIFLISQPPDSVITL